MFQGWRRSRIPGCGGEDIGVHCASLVADLRGLRRRPDQITDPEVAGPAVIPVDSVLLEETATTGMGACRASNPLRRPLRSPMSSN